MKYILIAVLLLATPLYAQTYEKVSSTAVKMVSSYTTESVMTISEIDKELDGINKDKVNITASYNKQMQQFTDRENKLSKMREEAVKLGVEEPIVTPAGPTIEVDE